LRFAGDAAVCTIGGVPTARGAAVIETGLDFALTPNAALGVSYSDQIGPGLSDQFVRTNLSMKF
jgi:fibronectin-binding autotransporter adhesin